MRTLKSAALATVALASATAPAFAATNQMRIAIQPTPEQFSRMTHGVQVLISQTAQTEVRMMTQDPDDKGRVTLAFLFINRSDRAVNIGPESINTSSLAFVSYDQLMEEQRKREGRKKVGHFFYRLGNALAADSASYQHGTFDYSGSSLSGGSFSGSGSFSAYNPYLAQRAQERASSLNEAHAEQMYQSFAINRSEIGSNLRTTTLMPMQQLQSQLTFEIPKASRNQRKAAPFTVTITLGTDQHVLSGYVGPAGTLPQIELTRIALPEQPTPAGASLTTSAPSLALTARPSSTRSSTAPRGAASIEAYHRGEYRGNPEMLGALAKQGYAPAQNDLASMYLAGTGVEQNYAEAFRLFRLAADQNLRDAQANLGWMYETGQGTKKDLALARRNYRLAADAGDEMAIAKISELDLHR